jgi:methionyl-tRNA formyltransferase
LKAVVFAYHNMGLAGLEALKRHEFEIQAVFSHADDPGENCWFGSVADWARKEGIPVFLPGNINTGEWAGRIEGLRPDVIFSFYYRHLICQRILDVPPGGAFNLHGSLLPAYRGRVPVNWVLVQGEKTTGVTLHYMVEKADAGDIVGQQAVDITFHDTAFTLYGKLCRAADILLDDVLPLIKTGKPPRHIQDEDRASKFPGRRPEDGRINWGWPAERIYNLIRAVTEPYPGAFTYLPGGEKMILWWGLPEPGGDRRKESGLVEIHETAVLIWAGMGAIRLLDTALSGKRYRNDEICSYFKNIEGIKLI